MRGYWLDNLYQRQKKLPPYLILECIEPNASYNYFTNNVKNTCISYHIKPPMDFAQKVTVAYAVKYLKAIEEFHLDNSLASPCKASLHQFKLLYFRYDTGLHLLKIDENDAV